MAEPTLGARNEADGRFATQLAGDFTNDSVGAIVPRQGNIALGQFRFVGLINKGRQLLFFANQAGTGELGDGQHF